MDNFPNYPAEIQEMILNGPALTPPDGVVPNFDDPPNGNRQAIVVIIVCLFMATTTFFTRLYSRIFVMKRLLLEDYVGVAVFGCYAGIAWSYIEFLRSPGFFVHQWNVRVKDTFHIAYVLLILPITYSLVMMLVKIAILLEWNRLFVPYPIRNTFFWASCTMMLVNVLVYISAIVSLSLACIPQEKLWYHWVPGKCINRWALDVSTASFNLAIDLFILLLPQRIIWNLRLTSGRRTGVSIVFGIGLLACTCAAGRLYSTAIENYDGDIIYDISRTFYWGLSEVTCTLMVFCFPAIPKAFADNAMLGKIIATARSWTGLATPRSGTASGNKSEVCPRTIGSATNNNIYRLADEDGQAMSLAEFALMRNQQACDHSNQVLGIVKTTKVDQRDESAPKSFADHCFERQHPWMERRGSTS